MAAMATIRTLMMALPLLSIAVAQEQNTNNNSSPIYQEQFQVVTALNGVSHALQCFGDILSSHTEKSGGALDGFKDFMRDSLKIHNQESESRAEVERLQKKVQDLERRLNQSQILAEHLAEQVKLLNTTASENSASGELLKCGPQEQNIKEEVEKYTRYKDWEALRTGLAVVLDTESKSYAQLMDVPDDYVSPLYEVVSRNYIDLIELLLCHGLPADIAGSNGFTMLCSAVIYGHERLVKLLLQQGADVNLLDDSNKADLVRMARTGRLYMAFE